MIQQTQTKKSRSRIFPDRLPDSHFNDTIILSDDAITLSDDDFYNTGVSNQKTRNFFPIWDPRIIISPDFLTQPRNSQAIVQSSPTPTQTPIRSRSPSTPETNRNRNINKTLVSSLHSISSPRPIGNVLTLQLPQLMNTKILLPVFNELFMVLVWIPQSNFYLPFRFSKSE